METLHAQRCPYARCLSVSLFMLRLQLLENYRQTRNGTGLVSFLFWPAKKAGLVKRKEKKETKKNRNNDEDLNAG